MRKQITIAFILIFSLFLAGSGIMVFNLVKTTASLRNLIGLHEIEDIRQELFNSVQKVSAYIFGSGEVFTNHLDEIVANTRKMHDSVRRCSDCHHEPDIHNELLETTQMVDLFEEQLSYLITIVGTPKRLYSKQEEVYQASSQILDRVQNMVNRAARSIDTKTEHAMDQLAQVYLLVAMTLAGTLILSFFIAHYLVRSITRPIDDLLQGTRKIAEGNWGYQSDFEASGEFRELLEAFNNMSRSLAQKRAVEQRHIEELRRTQHQLIEVEKLTALGTMAGGIAHDFNNILCGMIGHLNILARQIEPDDDQRKTIDTIEQAGFRAAELVKQLLTFARQKPMEINQVDLNACLGDALPGIEEHFKDKATIILTEDPDLPMLYGDVSQLEQVVVNLCINAGDAMPEGGSIFVATASVTLDEKFCASHPDATPGRYVTLTVRDTGAGINEKILPRVFDPFFTTKEVGKGTGLGLAMVYGIVKNHEGFCTIESAPGKGTTFTVYLPAVKEEGKKVIPVQEEVSLAGRTFLIVDDEAVVTSMLRDFLEELGCSVLVAYNGKEAIDIYSRNKDQIDLVILDIIMPVMDGRETFRELVEIDPEVRVLVSSGYIMNNETQDILSLGAKGFLQKPYTMEAVRRKLMEVTRPGN